MSCCFNAATSPQAGPPDPSRHVNYVQGMVLGVEEFRQEFAYLDGRDRWLARDLQGYGTLRGLAVKVSDTGANADSPDKWKVAVSAGVALEPCGHIVCVPVEQCGMLNAWLAAHGDKVSAVQAAQPGQPLRLNLVLAWRDCLTDSLPIPGTPCRSEDQLKAPSRVVDDFDIDFQFDDPASAEEAALREFNDWLASIPMLPWQNSASTATAFEAAVAAWKPGAVKPPAGITLGARDARSYLRSALRLWVTTLRPHFFGRACTCTPAAAPLAPTDGKVDGVLLARFTVPVEQPIGQSWRVKSAPQISEADRPFIVAGRALSDAMSQAAASNALAAAAWGGANVPLPPVLGRTVGAALLKGNGTVTTPVFGGLKVFGISAGHLQIVFDGYTPPAGQHQYVVKLLPQAAAGSPPVLVAFEDYKADHIALAVWNNPTTPAPQADVKALSLMVEVSEIRSTGP